MVYCDILTGCETLCSICTSHLTLFYRRFLRAKIQIAYLSTLGSDRAIKQALDVLPQGLEETYEGVLRRITSNNPGRIEELKCIFRWLCGSERVLDLKELAEAVSINPEDTELDLDGIATDPEDLAAFCSSLVTVDRRHDPPEISFAHYSVEEYLESSRILKSPMTEFHMDRYSVNRELAISCLQYLSFSDFAIVRPRSSSMATNNNEGSAACLKNYSFLNYAANNWYKHLRASAPTSECFDTEVQKHMQWFLHPNANGSHYMSWRQVINRRYSAIRHRKAFVLDLSVHPPLYLALAFGLDIVANHLLSQMTPHETGAMISYGLTPLHAAAMQGHPEMLETLLEAGVPIDAPTKGKAARNLTALHIAAEAGHISAVRFLLKAGASPHARSTAGTTAFYKAVRGGCEAVIDDLHNAGSDVNVRTWDDWTPLVEAIIENNVPVVNKLLAWGADPLIRRSRGLIHHNLMLTPVQLARDLKRTAIIDLLETTISKKENDTSTLVVGLDGVLESKLTMAGTESAHPADEAGREGQEDVSEPKHLLPSWDVSASWGVTAVTSSIVFDESMA